MAKMPEWLKPKPQKPDEEVDVDVNLGVIKVEVHHFFETPVVIEMTPATLKRVSLTLTSP